MTAPDILADAIVGMAVAQPAAGWVGVVTQLHMTPSAALTQMTVRVGSSEIPVRGWTASMRDHQAQLVVGSRVVCMLVGPPDAGRQLIVLDIYTDNP